MSEIPPYNPYYHPQLRMSCDHGVAVLFLPSVMSKQDIEEVEQAIEIQLRRFKRAAERNESASPTSVPPANQE